MDELELKHLAPYLPYGLNGIYFDEEREIKATVKIEHVHLPDELTIIDSYYEWFIKLSEFKPILRPMSDFDNSEADTEIFNTGNAYESVYLNDVKDLPYWEIEILLKHHFDVFGLIEKGLAIDINTLT